MQNASKIRGYKDWVEDYLKTMTSLGMTILEDKIKHNSCNTALKRFKSERIFKLMKSFVND